MIKSYYHATPFENTASIIGIDQKIKRGCDRVIYLAETPEDAMKFVAIRGYRKILVIEVLLNEEMVEESFDHSQLFFRCRAYTYPKDISINEFADVKTYEL